jgi:hypothetical protein
MPALRVGRGRMNGVIILPPQIYSNGGATSVLPPAPWWAYLLMVMCIILVVIICAWMMNVLFRWIDGVPLFRIIADDFQQMRSMRLR